MYMYIYVYIYIYIIYICIYIYIYIYILSFKTGGLDILTTHLYIDSDNYFVLIIIPVYHLIPIKGKTGRLSKFISFL